MSGVKIIQAPRSNNTQENILANSAALDFGDFVNFSSGFLARVAAGAKIQGYYLEQNKTVTSDNQTVAKAKGKFALAQGTEVFELTASAALAQADIGKYADIKLVTNAFQLDQASLSATAGQVHIIDVDPNRDGTTTLCRVEIAEPARLDFAQP